MLAVRLIGSLAVLGLCACTHLVQEPTQPVHVSSDPAAAAVYVDDRLQSDRTPMTVTLDPRRMHEVRVEKDCYAAHTRTLRPSMGVRTYGPMMIPVSQLDASVHAHLQPTCTPLAKKGG